jgi:hypothetical protein
MDKLLSVREGCIREIGSVIAEATSKKDQELAVRTLCQVNMVIRTIENLEGSSYPEVRQALLDIKNALHHQDDIGGFTKVEAVEKPVPNPVPSKATPVEKPTVEALTEIVPEPEQKFDGLEPIPAPPPSNPDDAGLPKIKPQKKEVATFNDVDEMVAAAVNGGDIQEVKKVAAFKERNSKNLKEEYDTTKV